MDLKGKLELKNKYDQREQIWDVKYYKRYPDEKEKEGPFIGVAQGKNKVEVRNNFLKTKARYDLFKDHKIEIISIKIAKW